MFCNVSHFKIFDIRKRKWLFFHYSHFTSTNVNENGTQETKAKIAYSVAGALKEASWKYA